MASVLRATTLLRARWEEPGLFHFSVKSSGLGPSCNDSSQSMVALGAVTTAWAHTGVVAKLIGHAIA